jgi:predicted transposase
MIAIKLKFQNELDNNFIIFRKQWNSVLRYSFNRFSEGKSLIEVWNLTKNLKNVDYLDISWRRSAAQKAEEIWKSTKNPKLIFGGKERFSKLKRKILTKEEFLESREMQIRMIGSKSDSCGNRKFKIDLKTLTGYCKLNTKISFKLQKTSKRNFSLLNKALSLAKNNKIPITYSLNKNYLHVIFDESRLINQNNFIKDRIMAIDLNPNYIGFSVIDGNRVLYKEVLKINACSRNKKRFELSQIAKYLSQIAYHLKVELVGIEKLSIKRGDHKKGWIFNKIINNDWHRGYFKRLLTKNFNLNGIKFQFLQPQYSSFIGCLQNKNDIDSVAASLEINRRLLLFKKIYLDKAQDKQEIIFPKWNPSELPTRWKEMVSSNNGISSWKDLFSLIKKSKSSYRFLYDDFIKSHKVFRFKSDTSLIDKCSYLN